MSSALNEPLLASGGPVAGNSVDVTVAGVSWMTVAGLMIAGVIGTSVLTFAGIVHSLGYLLPVIFIVGFAPVCLYMAIIMTRTRECLVERAKQEGRDTPALHAMGEVARESFQKRWAAPAVYLAVYGTTLLGQSSYLLAMGLAMQQTLYSVQPDLCLDRSLMYSCACLLIPLFLVRKLSESVWICLVNTLLVAVCIVVALSYLASNGERQDIHAFAPDLSFSSVMGGMTNIVYSYAGQWMIFEIMSSMHTPSSFPFAVSVAQPIMTATYLLVAVLGYVVGADQKGLLGSMGPSPWLSVAAGSLFVHVVAVYVIKSIVLARYVQEIIWPGSADAETWRSYIQFCAISAGMLAFSFVVADAVAFFDELMGVIGGLFAGPINFILPIVLYLTEVGRTAESLSPCDTAGPTRSQKPITQNKKREEDSQDERCRCSSNKSEKDASEADSTAAPASDSSPDSRTSDDEELGRGGMRRVGADEPLSPHSMGWMKLASTGFVGLPRWEALVIVFIFVVIALTMVVGVSHQVSSLLEQHSRHGGCRALLFG